MGEGGGGDGRKKEKTRQHNLKVQPFMCDPLIFEKSLKITNDKMTKGKVPCEQPSKLRESICLNSIKLDATVH